VIRVPGAIKRVTVAVLVNEQAVPDAAGNPVTTPRDPAELDALRELVSSAVGFDEARGDIITIKSMVLQSVPAIGTTAGGGLLERMSIDLMSIIQVAVLAIVTLILGLFVVRPLLARSIGPALDGSSPLAIASTQRSGGSANGALSGEIAGDDFDLPDLEIDPTFGNRARAQPGLPALRGVNDNDPVSRLRNMIGERQEETVEILRGWLEDEGESA
jgi:flagellar M-ring protein FliF